MLSVKSIYLKKIDYCDNSNTLFYVSPTDENIKNEGNSGFISRRLTKYSIKIITIIYFLINHKTHGSRDLTGSR